MGPLRRRSGELVRLADEDLMDHVREGDAGALEVVSVRFALDGLPADQRRVIELAYFGGFSHSEIADMLDAPVGTVKGRMRLALGKLRGRLESQVQPT